MPIKNIIFDLGGVIMNIDFTKTEKAFAEIGFPNFSDHMTQHHITPLFEAFETGKIDNDEFIRGVQKLSPKPVSAQQVVNAWNALLLDFPKARINLLEKLRLKYRLFLLSNTNAIHYEALQESLHAATGQFLEDIFEKTYFSHTTGLRKPDAAIFQLVLNENKLMATETLFIDDTAGNFSGAEQLGMQTLHLKPPTDITELDFFSRL